MPDKPNQGKRDHPIRHAHPAREGGAAESVGEGFAPSSGRRSSRGAARKSGYAEIRCRSNFSFLQGASHPEELIERAAELGYAALAITDRNTLAGVVRMHCAAKASGLKLLVGAEVTPVDAPPVTLYATDRAAYGRLCRIITHGRLLAIKGDCRVQFEDIARWNEGIIAAVYGNSLANCQLPIADCRLKTRSSASNGQSTTGNREWLHSYRDMFGDRLYLAASVHGRTDDERFLGEMQALSRTARVPLVASNDVHYHESERRYLQDVLTCIREHTTLEAAGTRLFANAERYLKPIDEMSRLFSPCPEAVARTRELADRCGFRLDELRYEYPEALCPPGRSPADYLAELTWRGAGERYPGGVPEKVRRLIEHELRLVGQLQYEPYFLTVWDIVQFARSRDIFCQGRGSAANSAVCYCLGITSVDPGRMEMLFERFLSAERNEPPDIDVDFEHERREEVFQYIYDKYGRDHAGIVAEVISYRPRSAIRDTGKALGLSLDHIDALAKKHEWWDQEAMPADFVKEVGLDPRERTVRMLGKLVRQLVGFPRHLSQHVGGFVITRGPLCEMVPIENGAMPDRTFIEWDKDDVDAMGILKIDCLALGMLTAIHKAFRMIQATERRSDTGMRRCPFVPSSLSDVPPEDSIIYDMICRADTVGVFQVESRAQMSMLPRLKPRCFYDLVIEVAIVRPGPIQGGMVHPYLRRRCGEEPITYPSETIRGVLERTLGVPLFQEQAMKLAVVAAGFTPGEADQLRRAMGAWRHTGDIRGFRTKFMEGMKSSGLSEEFAERCFEQISGFGEYGFPESHAASFALLVYVSAWLKRYYPAAFCAAIINSQPMGFYEPAQLVRDAREHGVTVRPVDVNFSGYDCRLEECETCDAEPRDEMRSEFPLVVPSAERRGDAVPAPLQGDKVDGEGHPAQKPWEGSDLEWYGPRKGLGRGGWKVCGSPETTDRVVGGRQPSKIGSSTKALADQPPVGLSADGTSGRSSIARRSWDPSTWGHGGPAVRLGMRLVKGISQSQVERIERVRGERPFTSVADLAFRSGTSRATLARLAAADAMGSLGLSRREALWQVLALSDEPPLFADLDPVEAVPVLPSPSLQDVVLTDYETVGLSLKAHPVSLIRRELVELRAETAKVLGQTPHGRNMRVGGLVLVRQRPSTAKGIVFCTLEDETGVANLIIPSQVYEKYRSTARGAVALLAEGRVERQGEVVHLNVRRLTDLSRALAELSSVSRDFH